MRQYPVFLCLFVLLLLSGSGGPATNKSSISATLPVVDAWQTANFYGLRIPIPPGTQWLPMVNTTLPSYYLDPYAHAVISYTTGLSDVMHPYRYMFVVSPWGGSLQDFIDSERRAKPEAIALQTIHDTTVAGLPGKVYQPTVTGVCNAGVYIALLPQDKLLYISTACLDQEPYARVIRDLQYRPDPTPVGGRPCPASYPPSNSRVEYANLMQFDEIVYHSRWIDGGNSIVATMLGPQYARVRCKLIGGAYKPIEGLQDGDATFLEPGTRVYTVRGYSPTFRLAVEWRGKWHIFESTYNPKAERGADQIDLGDKVSSIVIHRNNQRDDQPRTSLVATLTDPQEIGALVQMIETAPVDHTRRSTQNTYSLVFNYRDGTQMTSWYEPDLRRLATTIVLPPEFQTAIERALERRVQE